MNSKNTESLQAAEPGIRRQVTFWGLVLVLGLALATFNYTRLNAKNKLTNQYLGLVSEQQLLSQQLSIDALQVSQGVVDAHEAFPALISRFDEIFRVFRLGSTDSIPPIPDSLLDPLDAQEKQWRIMHESLLNIYSGIPAITEASKLSYEINQDILELSQEYQKIADYLYDNGAPREQIYAFTPQLILIERIANTAVDMNLGLTGLQTASVRLPEYLDALGQALSRFTGKETQSQSDAASVSTNDPDALERLADLERRYDALQADMQSIVEVVRQSQQIEDALNAVTQQGTALLVASKEFYQAINESNQRWDLNRIVGLLGVAFLMIAILALAFVFWRDSERRINLSVERNRKNQQDILLLLDEMTTLADGDLSVETTVGESMTGAIADSVNYAIESLRTLVTTINNTVEQLSEATSQTDSTAKRVASSSDVQAREIALADKLIGDIAKKMIRMSESAEDSKNVALASVNIANKGTKNVRLNIEAMEGIREKIQDTSKSIKRLGESSQEIGEIIGLINDIADRTNILALNAAIQASSAGEAGRGFAVVADEVQRLAERAGDATRQVEALVKAIQTDTNEAIDSMEQSTSEVVRGAKLAENAGSTLNEIEAVSQQLAGLIQGISKEAIKQAEFTNKLSVNMGVIHDITVETSRGITNTAASIGKLTNLSSDLRQSVDGFQLPDNSSGRGTAAVSKDKEDDDNDVVIGNIGALPDRRDNYPNL